MSMIKIMEKQLSGLMNNIDTIFNMPPLHYATWSGDLHLVKYFLAGGADPNHKDELGMTPLHYAAWEGFIGIISELIEAGAYINLRDKSGDSPLHKAVESGSIFAVQALLESGADPNICDNLNQAPIDFAVQYGYNEIARLLANRTKSLSKKLVGTLPPEHAYV